MKELIERIEGAERPSRELDAEIFIAACWPDWRIQIDCENFPEEVQPGRIQEPTGCGWRNAPAYTASLDAAMTLVPEGEGRWPQLYYTGPNPNNQRDGHRWQVWLKGSRRPIHGHSHHSSALALVAAALKARTAAKDR